MRRAAKTTITAYTAMLMRTSLMLKAMVVLTPWLIARLRQSRPASCLPSMQTRAPRNHQARGFATKPCQRKLLRLFRHTRKTGTPPVSIGAGLTKLGSSRRRTLSLLTALWQRKTRRLQLWPFQASSKRPQKTRPIHLPHPRQTLPRRRRPLRHRREHHSLRRSHSSLR